MPNIIKIDLYDFELYRFKVGSFFETQSRYVLSNSQKKTTFKNCHFLNSALRVLKKISLIVGKRSSVKVENLTKIASHTFGVEKNDFTGFENTGAFHRQPLKQSW